MNDMWQTKEAPFSTCKQLIIFFLFGFFLFTTITIFILWFLSGQEWQWDKIEDDAVRLLHDVFNQSERKSKILCW